MLKLGKIERPKISDFGESRRLFCIPLIPQFNQNDLIEDLKTELGNLQIQLTTISGEAQVRAKTPENDTMKSKSNS